MDALDKSRSFASYIIFRGSMSEDFKNMYDAMNLVNKLAHKKAPSKSALTRAYINLKAMALTYLSTREDATNTSDDRNIRITVAKAAVALANSFVLKEGSELKDSVLDIEKEMLRNRMLYNLSINKPNVNPDLVLASPNITNALENMNETDILKQAFKSSMPNLETSIKEDTFKPVEVPTSNQLHI